MLPNTLRCTGQAFTSLMYNREREMPVLREGRKEELGKEEEEREKSREGRNGGAVSIMHVRTKDLSADLQWIFLSGGLQKTWHF